MRKKYMFRIIMNLISVTERHTKKKDYLETANMS